MAMARHRGANQHGALYDLNERFRFSVMGLVIPSPGRGSPSRAYHTCAGVRTVFRNSSSYPHGKAGIPNYDMHRPCVFRAIPRPLALDRLGPGLFRMVGWHPPQSRATSIGQAMRIACRGALRAPLAHWPKH